MILIYIMVLFIIYLTVVLRIKYDFKCLLLLPNIMIACPATTWHLSSFVTSILGFTINDSQKINERK